MGIFGKSGGAMLTLFADTSSAAVAMGELGSQVDILNAKSNTFDTISDKIANMLPAKMQGLFVGMADALSAPVMGLLSAFEQVDMAKIGQQAGVFMVDLVNRAIQWGQLMQAGWEGFKARSAENLSNVILSADRIYDLMLRSGDALQAGMQGASRIAGKMMSWLIETVQPFVLNLQTGLQFAFSKAVEFFQSTMMPVIDAISAGLEVAVQTMMEGLGKIPILGEKLGLKGFKAQSFDEIASGKAANRSAAPDASNYADMFAENFANSPFIKAFMEMQEKTSEYVEGVFNKAADTLTSAFNEKEDRELFPGLSDKLKKEASGFEDKAAEIMAASPFQLAKPELTDPSAAASEKDESAPKMASGKRKGIQRDTSGFILQNADGSLGEGVTESRLGTLSRAPGNRLNRELPRQFRPGKPALGDMLPGRKGPIGGAAGTALGQDPAKANAGDIAPLLAEQNNLMQQNNAEQNSVLKDVKNEVAQLRQTTVRIWNQK